METEYVSGFPMIVYSRYEQDLFWALARKGEDRNFRLMLLSNSWSQLLTCGNQGPN